MPHGELVAESSFAGLIEGRTTTWVVRQLLLNRYNDRGMMEPSCEEACRGGWLEKSTRTRMDVWLGQGLHLLSFQLFPRVLCVKDSAIGNTTCAWRCPRPQYGMPVVQEIMAIILSEQFRSFGSIHASNTRLFTLDSSPFIISG